MKLFRQLSSVFLMTMSAAALARARLDVRIKPAHPQLKANADGYVGYSVERDVHALRHFSLGTAQHAAKAAPALRYYP
ncbi:outer membrane protein assembly factor, partial [Pseudomonas syringae]